MESKLLFISDIFSNRFDFPDTRLYQLQVEDRQPYSQKSVLQCQHVNATDMIKN